MIIIVFIIWLLGDSRRLRYRRGCFLVTILLIDDLLGQYGSVLFPGQSVVCSGVLGLFLFCLTSRSKTFLRGLFCDVSSVYLGKDISGNFQCIFARRCLCLFFVRYSKVVIQKPNQLGYRAFGCFRDFYSGCQFQTFSQNAGHGIRLEKLQIALSFSQ